MSAVREDVQVALEEGVVRVREKNGCSRCVCDLVGEGWREEEELADEEGEGEASDREEEREWSASVSVSSMGRE